MSKKAEKRTGSFVVRTLGQAAEFFGVSVGAIRKWRGEGCPGAVAGGWDLAAIARWRVARLRTVADPELRDVKLRRETALARRAELDAARLAGETIPLAKHQEIVNDRMRCFVSVLNRLPAELLPRVMGRPVTEAELIAREWLRDLRKWMAGDAPHPEDLR